jgi:hypothetical protein
MERTPTYATRSSQFCGAILNLLRWLVKLKIQVFTVDFPDVGHPQSL